MAYHTRYQTGTFTSRSSQRVVPLKRVPNVGYLRRQQQRAIPPMTFGVKPRPSTAPPTASIPKPPPPTYALVIGIEYTQYAKQGRLERLPGCHFDTKTINDILTYGVKVPASNITTMTDTDNIDSKISPLYPSRSNIVAQLNKLLALAQKTPNITIWITYSGHGTSFPDEGTRDEKDKADEAIVPADFLDSNSNVIVDDFFASYLAKFPSATKINVIFDSCHSGSCLDLPYLWKTAAAAPVQENKNKIVATISFLSGCRDNQTSASDLIDTATKSRALTWRGALTCAFENTMIKYNYKPTCEQLLKDTQAYLLTRGYDQVPQFSCSKTLTLRSTAYPFTNNHPTVSKSIVKKKGKDSGCNCHH